MTQIAGLIDGSNINHDYQVTALAKAIMNSGVISGLLVSTNLVEAGEAFIPCTRTNGQIIILYYENSEDLTIDTSGNKKVWIGVDQSVIDNGSGNAVDGTGIATIRTGPSYPSENYIPLASITGGTITDARKLITGKAIVREGFPTNKHLVLNRLTGEEEVKNVSDTATILPTHKLRVENPAGGYDDILYSNVKNDLASAGQFVRTVQMGEALASAGYSSNVVNTFATSGSNSGTFATMGGRVQFPVRTKIVSVKYPHNASNTSGAIVITMGVSPFTVLGTYPVANGTKEAAGINFVCEPGVVYQIGVNSTANFGGLHANYTLTAGNIEKGFISGCYANANYDATWRLQEVVVQEEMPANYAIAVVGKMNYPITLGGNISGSIPKMGIRFSVPYACKLRGVKTGQNASSSSARLQLRDDSDVLITEIYTTTSSTGVNTFDFGGYDLLANTVYRLVENDSANFGGVYNEATPATYQSFFPYCLSGTHSGGNTSGNVWNISEINLDFGGKAYKARANRSIELPFARFVGFVSGPKSVGDSVELISKDGFTISGFSGLSPSGIYYVSNIGGIISTTKGTITSVIGQALSTSVVEINRRKAANVSATLTGSGLFTPGGPTLVYYTNPVFVQSYIHIDTPTLPVLPLGSGINAGQAPEYEISKDLENWSNFNFNTTFPNIDFFPEPVFFRAKLTVSGPSYGGGPSTATASFPVKY